MSDCRSVLLRVGSVMSDYRSVMEKEKDRVSDVRLQESYGEGKG